MTKEQYEDFRLMLKGCGAGLPMYSTLNRFERVWFSSIIEILTEKDKQIEELKEENNKLLDVINNQDVKIADLEEQNSQMFNTIALQEQQIEKMKCCENCKHKKSEVDRCELLMYSMNACLCKNKDKWELKE